MIQLRFRIFMGLITICFFSFMVSRVVLDLFFSRHQMVRTAVYSHEIKVKQRLMLIWTTFFNETPKNRLKLMNECPDLKVRRFHLFYAMKWTVKNWREVWYYEK